jgi:hypothetical protein
MTPRALPGRSGLTIATVALVLGCAPAKLGVEREKERLLVMASASTAQPLPSTALRHLAGEDQPAAMVAREAGLALGGSFRISGMHVSDDPVSAVAEAVRIAQETGVPKALTLHLATLDLSSVETLGQAEFVLESRLIDVVSGEAATEVHRGRTSLRGYRSKNDWREHVRAATRQALQTLSVR